MKRVAWRLWGRCVGLLFGCLWLSVAEAQVSDMAFASDRHVDAERSRQLLVELESLSFFKDNEFAGKVVKGYTLPGFWLQPKLTYYPTEKIKLELGAHLLVYHGANKYPSMAYQDIAYWKGNQYQNGTHILPYFRAQMALSEHVDVVLGSL